MPMPKASVDKDNTPVFGQDNVRASHKTPVIGSVPEPLSEQKPPYKQFGLGVPAFDGAHDLASLCG